MTSDPETCAELLARGDEAFTARAYDEATRIYERAAAAADAGGACLAEALAQVARGRLLRGEVDEAERWLARAAEQARDAEPLGWSRYLGVRGRVEWKRERLADARATFEALYAYCVALSLHDRAVDAAHMVALVAPPAERIEWAQRGIAAAEAGAERWLGPLWNNLGWTYDELGRHDEALAALREARVHHHARGDEVARRVADWSVGHALRMVGSLDEAEVLLESTRAWAAERLERDESDATAQEWLGFAHRELGQLALARGDRAAARAHLEEARRRLDAAGAAQWGPGELATVDALLAETAP